MERVRSVKASLRKGRGRGNKRNSFASDSNIGGRGHGGSFRLAREMGGEGFGRSDNRLVGGPWSGD